MARTVAPAKKSVAAASNKLLLTLRDEDSPHGVTRKTLQRAAKALGMKETQMIHLALRSFIREQLPSYDVNAPALTDAQIEGMSRRSPKMPAGKVLSSLLPEG